MQQSLFAELAPKRYRPDADKVRRRLHGILAELRSAQSESLKPTRLSLYRSIFPQMTLFLPEEEGAQLRLAFESQLKRFEAA